MKSFLLLAVVLALAGPGPGNRAAMAQTVAVSPVCARQCAAASTVVRANPPEVQSCLIRCNAGQVFERGAGRTPPATHGRGTPAAPPPVRSATTAPGRPAPATYGVATGYGAASVAPAPNTNYATLQTPTGQRLTAASRENYQPVVRGLSPAALGAGIAAARPGGSRAGAIYLAPPPSMNYGLAYGQGDRLVAHGQAERNCNARGGNTCRLAMEFTDRCGAVAQAKRANGLLRTADPSTFTVTFAAGGAGPTKEVAEAQAVADCRTRDRSAVCEVVASGCGG